MLIPHKIRNNCFWLSPQHTLFWEEQKALIISDLHIGKSGHFRKAGIAVPQAVLKNDMQRLMHEISQFKPNKIIVVGDMFHSRENKELEFFLKWRSSIHSNIILVEGNHDILKKQWYNKAGIDLKKDYFSINDFAFTHHIHEDIEQKHFVFSGHIHPAIELKAANIQTIRLPCFAFYSNHAILPAFGTFTGMHTISQKNTEHIYAILPNNKKLHATASVLKVK